MLRISLRIAVALLLLLGSLDSGSVAQQLPTNVKRLELDHGVLLHYPANWIVLEKQFANASALVATAGPADATTPLARTLVTAERQMDHQAAVRRLADIAAEVNVAPVFRTIEDWPALERRHVSPVDRAGQRADQREDDLALGLTTAIAAGDVLIRLETTLFREAGIRIARARQMQIATQAVGIGRGIVTPTKGVPTDTTRDIGLLSATFRARSAPRSAASSRKVTLDLPDARSLPIPSPVPVPLLFGELEIAASRDGQHVVIASNHGIAVSHNGMPFSFEAITLPFDRRGDPSIAVGPSGAFYTAYIGLPEGQAEAHGFTGCTTAISKSVRNGNRFEFLSHAVHCPKNGPGQCFPDQAHIAVDPVNIGDGGADQVYAVYRRCEKSDPNETECKLTTIKCRGQPSIVCSRDGGTTWGLPRIIEQSKDADFPRVAVSPDGSVYVVYRNGNLLKLAKYGSCSKGLMMEPAFPIVIPVTGHRPCSETELIDRCHCPIPGLDRCNRGNLLSSPMLAVDDVDHSRIYAAVAVNSSKDNDDVVVLVSPDGGRTWPHEVTINARMSARRFMPWVCSTNGRAYVSWYDRRAKTKEDNDLTDYFVGMAVLEAGTLKAGPEIKLTSPPDPQCGRPEGGTWHGGVRHKMDSEGCSRQPQLGGICGPKGGGPCDFGCRPGEKPCPPSCNPGRTCDVGSGKPKYGDYNGNACVAGRIFLGWASATPPGGLPAPTAGTPDGTIRIYSATIPAYGPP
jgi:hypothetical protein